MVPYQHNAFQCNWVCSLWNTRSGRSHQCWCSGHCDKCLGSPHIHSDLALSSGHRSKSEKQSQFQVLKMNVLSCDMLDMHLHKIPHSISFYLQWTLEHLKCTNTPNPLYYKSKKLLYCLEKITKIKVQVQKTNFNNIVEIIMFKGFQKCIK